MRRLFAVLVCGSCLAASALAGDWTDRRTVGPLKCHADFSLQPLEELLRECAALQDDLTRATGVPAGKEPIEVYLFARQETYAAYLKQYLPNVAYRRALYVKADGPGMVFAYQSDELPIDLRHECTHALLHAAIREVPQWLDEGLAEYFEQPRAARANDNPYLAHVNLRAAAGHAPDIEELERKTAESEMGKPEYRDAWAAVHFLLHGPAEARTALRGYLDDLRAKQGSAETPLSSRLKQRWPQPSAAIAEHFCAWK